MRIQTATRHPTASAAEPPIRLEVSLTIPLGDVAPGFSTPTQDRGIPPLAERRPLGSGRGAFARRTPRSSYPADMRPTRGDHRRYNPLVAGTSSRREFRGRQPESGASFVIRRLAP